MRSGRVYVMLGVKNRVFAMIKGLLWLPLLAVFIWLAWAGWNEYQKLESYRVWAQSFQRAKYDIYSVLGQNGSDITWGKPTRSGPIQLQTFSLTEVEALNLLVEGQIVDPENLPTRDRQVALQFQISSGRPPIQIPFTDLTLAAQWANQLQKDLNRLKLGPT